MQQLDEKQRKYLAFLALLPAIIHHGKAMQRRKHEDEGSGSQRLVVLPRCDEIVLNITDVELNKFGFDVVEVSAPVIRK
jgi:hypothetical protein